MSSHPMTRSVFSTSALGVLVAAFTAVLALFVALPAVASADEPLTAPTIGVQSVTTDSATIAVTDIPEEATGVAIWYRGMAGGSWQNVSGSTPLTTISISDLTSGAGYWAMARSLGADGVTSDWTLLTPVIIPNPSLTPPSISLDSVTSTSAVISLSEVASGAEGVELRYRSDKNPGWSYLTAGALDPTATIDDLAAGGSYWVQARSLSEAGVGGDWSSLVAVHTPDPSLAAPSLSLGSVTATSAVLNIAGAPEGAATVEMRYRQVGVSGWHHESTPAENSTITASSLISGGSYWMQARSVAADGSAGDWSLLIPVTTLNPSLTAPSLTLAATTTTSATLDLADVPVGAETIEVRYRPVLGGSWNQQAAGASAETVTLTGLDAGYSYWAQARSLDGNLSSEWSTPMTLIFVPNPNLTAPTVTLEANSSTSMHVEVSDVPEAATKVVVRYRPVNIFTWQEVTIVRPADDVNISDLDPDVPYWFQARSADDAEGTSDWSALSKLAPPPLDVTLIRPAVSPSTDNTVEITWSGLETNADCEFSPDQINWFPCPPSPILDDSGTFPAGSFSMSFRAIDRIGQSSSVVTVSFVILDGGGDNPDTVLGDAPAAAPTLTPEIPVSALESDAEDAPVDDDATFECSVNKEGAAAGAWSACDPNEGEWGESEFTDDASNEVSIRAVNANGVDDTPVTTYVWTSTQEPNAEAAVDASDFSAGAHPDVTGDITLHGGHNPKWVTLDMPLGFNGALSAIDEYTECFDWGMPAEWMMCDWYYPESKIGHISGVGVSTPVGTITDAEGDVFLTSTDENMSAPAGVWTAVRSPSHPELGVIYAKGVVKITQKDNGVINGEVRQRIEIDNVPEQTVLPVLADPEDPQSVWDFEPGPRFHINSVHLELDGDPEGGIYPLITNPTTCDAHSFEGEGGTWSADGQGGDGPDVPAVSVDYPVDECEGLNFDPQFEQSYTATDPISGIGVDWSDPSIENVGTSLESKLVGFRSGIAGTVATVDLGEPYDATERRAAMRNMTVIQSHGMGANYDAFAGDDGQCPGDASSTTGIFTIDQCPAAARVGSVQINTPLLHHPLVGDVYLIRNNPLPWLGIHIDDTTNPDGTNPFGVELNFTLLTDLNCVDLEGEACTASLKRVLVFANNLPDVPMDSIVLDLSGTTARAATSGGDYLQTLILATPGVNTGSCIPTDAVYATIISGSGSSAARQQPVSMGHCVNDMEQPTIERTFPASSTTTETTASFMLTDNNASGTKLTCRLDAGEWADCPPNPVQLTGLSIGRHDFYVRAESPDGVDGSQQVASTWTVEEAVSEFDATLVFNGFGGTNAQFAWTRTIAGGSATCSKDGGSFASCAIPPSSTGGLYTWLGGRNLPAGVHTLTVRFTSPDNDVVERTASFTTG